MLTQEAHKQTELKNLENCKASTHFHREEERTDRVSHDSHSLKAVKMFFWAAETWLRDVFHRAFLSPAAAITDAGGT